MERLGATGANGVENGILFGSVSGSGFTFYRRCQKEEPMITKVWLLEQIKALSDMELNILQKRDEAEKAKQLAQDRLEEAIVDLSSVRACREEWKRQLASFAD